MQFEGDITANHTMTAFSRDIYRDIKIHGTKGELVGVMEKRLIEVRPFGKPVRQETWEKTSTVGGHGGGDQSMMHDGFV